jgi:predicted N-acetyltransferase YhbS
VNASIIRFARDEDLPAFEAIERAAGEAFRAIGMALVADDAPFSIEELRGYAESGSAWVATMDGTVVGYLVADVVDGAAHVEQVSVHPNWAHRGLGRDLIDACARWASASGYPGLTLTTFVDVPWNGPYYRRLGFRTMTRDAITPGLRALRAHEASKGLDRWPRECLRLDLGDDERDPRPPVR